MKLPKNIAVLGNVADKDRTRYALNNVQLMRKDNTATATASNARTLTTVSWKDEGPDMEVLIDAKALKRDGKSALEMHEEDINGFATFEGRAGTVKIPTSDGRFPDWKGVLPKDKEKPAISVNVNAEYLSNTLSGIAKIQSPNKTDQVPIVELSIYKDKAGDITRLVIKAKGQGDFKSDILGIVLPVRESR